MLFNFLFTVAFKNVKFLFLQLIQASNQKNRPKFTFLQFLQNYQLIQTINEFVSLFDLLVKFIGLLFLIFFNNSIHISAYYLLNYVRLNFSDNSIRLHNYIILISCLSFILQQELFTIDLRSYSYRIDVFVLLQSPLNHNYQLLVIDILSVLFDYYVS